MALRICLRPRSCLAATFLYRLEAQQPSASKQSASKQSKAATSPTDPRTFLNTYCLGCHSAKLRTAGLDLETIDAAHPEARAEIWEKVITRLRAGSMPPTGMPRPEAKTYDAVATSLENTLDKAWAANPTLAASAPFIA